MNTFLLVFSIFMNLLCCGILRNDFCKKEVENALDLQSFNALSSICSAATLALIAVLSGSMSLPSVYTLLLSILFGIATALNTIFHMRALETGPLSYTSVITFSSMVIPALSGLFFFGESVSVGQYIGIALMLVSIACSVDTRKDTGKVSTSLRWLLFCLGAVLTSGSVGIMQKVHQNSSYKEELSVFLVLAFLFSTAYSLVMALALRKKGLTLTVTRGTKRKKYVLYGVVCGVGFALCNQINMYLAGAMEAILFYPTVNGGGMLLTSAAGLVLWKEQLNRRQWFGIIIGAVAIFLLCGLF